METRQIHVRDLSTVTGIQQYEHCVQSIFFLGLEDFEGTIYLSLESDKFSEDVALTNNTFIIGQPMTRFNTTYTCQIYGIVGTGEKIQLSKQFRMAIYKSNNISGEAGEYPIDPNLTNGIDQYITEKESEIDDYVEQVIESIPSDYTLLNAQVTGGYALTTLFEQGTINSAGRDASNSARIRTKGSWQINQPVKITCTDDYEMSKTTYYNNTLLQQQATWRPVNFLMNPMFAYRIVVKRKDGADLTPSDITNAIVCEPIEETEHSINANCQMKCISHRGYSLSDFAPENTFHAFEYSKKFGYRYIETDVQFTSDNVPVLLHDATINRTGRNADGTTISSDIAIADITYAQVLEYDFGIYAGSQYAGTKIPKFEDFIKWCKANCIHPYIEIKSQAESAEDREVAHYTDAQIGIITDIVTKESMERDVTFIAFGWKDLIPIKNALPSVELGLNSHAYITQTITNAENLKTGKNHIFFINNRNMSASYVSKLENSEYGTVFYAPNHESHIEDLPTTKCEGIITDRLMPCDLYGALIGDLIYTEVES